MNNKEKQIRAVYDDQTITVYQAYNQLIADAAVANQTFTTPPFKMERMTWIKPSFLWMMYRCGWAQKQNQERVLAIKIKRSGFQWALDNACLSHFDPEVHSSEEAWKAKLVNAPVRVQWDPERDIHLEKMDYRSIQIGLSGEAVQRYVNEWIVSIEDITPHCKKMHALIASDIDEAIDQLPKERLYRLS